jgi:hypothetical protein
MDRRGVGLGVGVTYPTVVSTCAEANRSPCGVELTNGKRPGVRLGAYADSHVRGRYFRDSTLARARLCEVHDTPLTAPIPPVYPPTLKALSAASDALCASHATLDATFKGVRTTQSTELA